MGARLSAEPPGLDGYLDQWSSLHGGYDPRGSRLTRTWLAFVYRVARPLARARVPPDLLTLLGLVAGGGVVGLCLLGRPWVLAAALVVVFSGVLDGLDGAVAVLRRRASAWGAVLDSVVDRLVDVLYLVALWVVGAPGWLCVLSGVLTFVQEYVRARAAAAGMAEIGVVTVWERPTRVIVTSAFLLGAGLYDERFWASAGVAVSVALGVIGCTQLLIVVRRHFHPPR